MSDILSSIDEVIDATTDRCARCNRHLPADCPSLDWCSPECQQAWAAAYGDPLAGGVDDMSGLGTAMRWAPEVEADDYRRRPRRGMEGSFWRQRICAWLTANWLNPNNVPEHRAIITSHDTVTVWELVRTDDGQIAVDDLTGEPATRRRSVPLVEPWPDDLFYEHHHSVSDALYADFVQRWVLGASTVVVRSGPDGASPVLSVVDETHGWTHLGYTAGTDLTYSVEDETRLWLNGVVREWLEVVDDDRR